MSTVDIILLIVSMTIVVGISSLLPIAAYKDYLYEKKRNQDLQNNIER
jgi:hypothetical protein